MPQRKFTEGPVLKSIIRLATPIILANMLQTAYQLTDTFWVGRLGKTAVAAVTASFPVLFLVMALGGGFTIAGSILVAQFHGKGDRNAVNHITEQTLAVMSVVALVLAIGGILLTPYLLKAMGVETAVYAQAKDYLQWMFAGMLFGFGFMIFQSLMRGTGDVRTPLFIVAFTVLLNLVLDPLFIFGYGDFPALGVRGAALATLVTQGLSSLAGLYLLWHGKRSIYVRFKGFRPDWPLIRHMFRLGIPATVEQSTRAGGMTAMIFLVSGFGTLAMATYGIGMRITSFVIIPALGLSMATSALVGQNLGAGKSERAVRIARISFLTGFLALETAGILVMLFARPLARFFIPGEPGVIREAQIFLHIVAWSYGFIGMQMAQNGAFRGSGNPKLSMLLSILTLWVLRLPLAFLLSHYTALDMRGIWWSFPISNLVAAAVALYWFYFKPWHKRRLTREVSMQIRVGNESIIEESWED